MNPKETGFLQQILNDPEDETVRLVYADWLEDQDDVRGELVRLRCELAKLLAKDKNLKKLRKREKELIAVCDEDWLVLLERADWKKRYLELEPSAIHKARWALAVQEKIGGALRNFETEFGCKLPRSYKAFAHVFGPGEMAGYFRLTVPSVSKKLRDTYELYDVAAKFRKFCHSEGDLERQWLDRVICFAWTIGGEPIVWDTATVTDPIGHEYRVCWLDRREEVYKRVDTFRLFIDEVCLRVLEEEGLPTPQEFNPYRA